MRRTVVTAASAALVLLGGVDARAQFFHPRPKPPPTSQSSNPQDVCNQMRTMPNPPMSYDACMQMAGSAATMQNSMNDPAGQRPGDANMTCDQIKAEIMANGGIHMNQQHVAQAQTAATNFQAKNAQVQSEASALMAEETATNAAASAASFIPGVGNAVGAAAAAKNQAETDVFNAHAQKVLQPAEQQMMSSTGTVVSDMATQMQANPRQARLMSLAEQRNCH